MNFEASGYIDEYSLDADIVVSNREQAELMAAPESLVQHCEHHGLHDIETGRTICGTCDETTMEMDALISYTRSWVTLFRDQYLALLFMGEMHMQVMADNWLTQVRALSALRTDPAAIEMECETILHNLDRYITVGNVSAYVTDMQWA